MDKINVTGLELECIVGIYPQERTTKQPIIIDLEIAVDTHQAAISDRIEDTIDYDQLINKLVEWASPSCFALLESLGDFLAKRLIKEFSLRGLRMKLSKQNIKIHSARVGIEITRGQLN